MLLREPCLACNRLCGEAMCDLCLRLEHAETEAQRVERERHGTWTAAYREMYGGNP